MTLPQSPCTSLALHPCPAWFSQEHEFVPLKICSCLLVDGFSAPYLPACAVHHCKRNFTWHSLLSNGNCHLPYTQLPSKGCKTLPRMSSPLWSLLPLSTLLPGNISHHRGYACHVLGQRHNCFLCWKCTLTLSGVQRPHQVQCHFPPKPYACGPYWLPTQHLVSSFIISYITHWTQQNLFQGRGPFSQSPSC